MKNPWLEIPASDYDNHMKSPSVGQSSFMADVFKNALNKYTPNDLAILGCATGNGLEHIDSDTVKKVTVFDINSEYLEILKKRFSSKIQNLKTIHADLKNHNLKTNEYSFILAGLIFEYLDPEKLLQNIANALKSQGIMLTILQLPSGKLSKVSNTQFTSLEKLSSIMKLISPEGFNDLTEEAGLINIDSKTFTLDSGKRFYIGIYKKRR